MQDSSSSKVVGSTVELADWCAWARVDVDWSRLADGCLQADLKAFHWGRCSCCADSVGVSTRWGLLALTKWVRALFGGFLVADALFNVDAAGDLEVSLVGGLRYGFFLLDGAWAAISLVVADLGCVGDLIDSLPSWYQLVLIEGLEIWSAWQVREGSIDLAWTIESQSWKGL